MPGIHGNTPNNKMFSFQEFPQKYSRDVGYALVSSFSSIFGHQFLHEFHLNLLNLEESLPLVDDQVVELFVQMADF